MEEVTETESEPKYICTWCDTELEDIDDEDNPNDYVCPRCKLEF